MKNINICYLCGESLLSDQKTNVDHVPPKQFHPTAFRLGFNPDNLLTLPVHRKCNKLYQKDEDYFFNSLGILSKGSLAGDMLWDDLARQYQRPENRRLGQMIAKEFERRPSGLYLPNGLIAKRFDPNRIWRIVWKITRGLFFNEYDRFLPENSHPYFQILYDDQKPPSPFDAVFATPSRGQYPDIFDFKYLIVPEVNNYHLWALRFWGKIIKLVSFHDPDCKCEICSD